MKIDLPQCNFKRSRNSFDGNCISLDDYKGCEIQIKLSTLKAQLEECAEEIENCYGRETDLTKNIRELIGGMDRRDPDEYKNPDKVTVEVLIDVLCRQDKDAIILNGNEENIRVYPGSENKPGGRKVLMIC